MSDPNSAHQLWSKWEFVIREAGRTPTAADVENNVARWVAKGFGRAGRIRISRTIIGWRIELLIEGVPASDPDYVCSVRKQFQERFVEKGFGPFATSNVHCKIMAGNAEDGKPYRQMIEMPHVSLLPRF